MKKITLAKKLAERLLTFSGVALWSIVLVIFVLPKLVISEGNVLGIFVDTLWGCCPFLFLFSFIAAIVLLVKDKYDCWKYVEKRSLSYWIGMIISGIIVFIYTVLIVCGIVLAIIEEFSIWGCVLGITMILNLFGFIVNCWSLAILPTKMGNQVKED